MGEIDKSFTISSPKKQSTVIKSITEIDMDLNPGPGYEPAFDDLVSLDSADYKHYRHDTAKPNYEIEGVIMEYDKETKIARVCTRGKILQSRLNVLIEENKLRKLTRAMRQLGLDLVQS